MSNTLYCQTIPNSHWWTNLNQILTHFNIIKDDISNVPEYLTIGLNNSIEKGYKLKQIKELDLDQLYKKIFISIDSMIKYINSETFDLNEFLEIIKTTIEAGINLTNGIKMERNEIYKCVDGERDYQDLRWNSNLREGDVPDEEKPIAEWLNYIEYHLNKAKNENYHLNKIETLDELRKVTALAVRCMEIHGCPPRQITLEEDITMNLTKNPTCSCDNCSCDK